MAPSRGEPRMYFVADNVRDIGLPLDGVFFRRDGVVCIVKRELCRWRHLEESRGCILSQATSEMANSSGGGIRGDTESVCK